MISGYIACGSAIAHSPIRRRATIVFIAGGTPASRAAPPDSPRSASHHQSTRSFPAYLFTGRGLSVSAEYVPHAQPGCWHCPSTDSPDSARFYPVPSIFDNVYHIQFLKRQVGFVGCSTSLPSRKRDDNKSVVGGMPRRRHPRGSRVRVTSPAGLIQSAEDNQTSLHSLRRVSRRFRRGL